MNIKSGSCLTLWCACVVLLVHSATARSAAPTEKTTTAGSKAPAPVDYNRDIQPILSENCFYCHGPDKDHREADLRLDVPGAAVEAGVIAPGQPEESEFYYRIASTEEHEVMPPPAAHKTLTERQKELLTRWIAEGAVYQEHWAYKAPERPPVPEVVGFEAERPIDAFIRARLRDQGLSAAPEADRRTLIRRLSLDLLGLPPEPDEVEAFVEDEAPDAYERLVDRLLASPRYGERMAVPWLDVARYADTVGFHGDQNQHAWAYRDYVIRAFNENKPFDRFTIEQLAGDLLPDATAEQRVATCFNRLNMVTREGGAQAKEYMAKYNADRVRTVGMAWLGSTIGCAECHDHKFDPFLARDFYALGAFFADVKQWGVYADYGYTPNPDLKGYNNDYPFPPEIEVESPYLAGRLEQLRREVEQVAADSGRVLERDPKARSDFEAYRSELLAYLERHPSGWQVLSPEVESTEPTAPKGKKNARPKEEARPKEIAKGPEGSTSPSLVVMPDGRALFYTNAISTDTFRVEPGAGWLASIRVELLASPNHSGSILRNKLETATLSLSASIARQGKKKPSALAFRHAEADLAEPRYANGSEIIGIAGGWKIANRLDETHVGVWTLDRPVRLDEGDALEFRIPNDAAGCVRIATSPFAPGSPDATDLPAGLAELLRTADGEATSGPALLTYLRATVRDDEAFGRLVALESEILACRGGRTPVMVTESWEPAISRLLPRGNWQDESGPVVQPAVPHFLPQPEAAAEDRRLNRLDLAEWLVGPENPLTARVVVNRLWKQFFGAGLSAQVDDLGAQGEPPVHPELLDWLAVDFREGGWDIKRMVKQIVMSATYRQASDPSPEALESDPDNRLLSHQSSRRLEAEFVRDNALSIAGLIAHDLGGPSIKPYQPADYYENIQFPDRPYEAEDDDRQYRRGVYTHWQRTFLHPMLANFDAPSREDCIAARTQANSPQQALTLLNDPTFVEAARVFAARLLIRESLDDRGRLDLAFQKALARPADDEERRSLQRLLDALRSAYAGQPGDARKLLGVGNAPTPDHLDPIELAAWTGVCRVVLNLHETITRY